MSGYAPELPKMIRGYGEMLCPFFVHKNFTFRTVKRNKMKLDAVR